MKVQIPTAVMSGAVGAVSAPRLPNVPPAAHKGQREEIVPGPRPESYSYDLVLDPGQRTLSGAGTIRIVNDQPEPLNEVYLRLWGNAPSLARDGGNASINNVLVNGRAAQTTVDRTVAKVALANPLLSGETLTLSFDTHIRAPKTMGRTGIGRDGSLYFGNALPILAVRDEEGWNLDPYVVGGEAFYSLASNWNVHLEAPDSVQLVTTGSSVGGNTASNRQSRDFTAPSVREFIVTALPGTYEKQERQVGDTTVRTWAPAGQAQAGARMLDTAAKSLDWYNRRYGTFHLDEMDVIATRGLGGGMEYPGVTLNDTGGMSQDMIIAHENAHQWFYSMVGNNQYDDPWLDESFTTFLTSEYTGRRPMDIARAVAERQHRRDPVPPPGFGSSVRVSSPMHVLAGHGYVGMIYGRGAQVLADLKREIGEEKFLNGMRAHFAARRNGIATTRDFMNTMNEAAGRDLTEWFSQHQVVAVEPSANEHLDPNTEL